jgi:DNA-3-methyladenine glycosylase II
MPDDARFASIPSHNKLTSHFRANDPIMARAIDEIGLFKLQRNKNHFQTLCKAIVSQQISTKAAETIHGRFCALFPGLKPNSAALQNLSEEEMRSVGLSRQKIVYLKDLSLHFENKTIRPHRLLHQSNDEIIRILIAVKGIGRWTAEMFLIFSLNRLDVLPVDDLGLQKGIMKLYSLPELPTRKEILKFGERWEPFQTVAVWYCWRSLDANIISY